MAGAGPVKPQAASCFRPFLPFATRPHQHAGRYQPGGDDAQRFSLTSRIATVLKVKTVARLLADEVPELQAGTGGNSWPRNWAFPLRWITGFRLCRMTLASNSPYFDDALGADISECLPEGEAGRRWKRLANEIQMSLHASAASESRRQGGEPLVNGVWFGVRRFTGHATCKEFERAFFQSIRQLWFGAAAASGRIAAGGIAPQAGL